MIILAFSSRVKQCLLIYFFFLQIIIFKFNFNFLSENYIYIEQFQSKLIENLNEMTVIFISPYSLLLSSLSYNLNFGNRILNMSMILYKKSHFPIDFTSFNNQIIFKSKIIHGYLSIVLSILDIKNLRNAHFNKFRKNLLDTYFLYNQGEMQVSS